MTDRVTDHRRLQSLLLIQKILTLRENSSPFTLLLDSVEQSAKPLIRHYIQNAKIAKTYVIFVSFETLNPPLGIGVMIKGRRKSPAALRKEIVAASAQSKKTLLIIDTLHPLATLLSPSTAPYLPTFLSSLLLSPTLSLLATYHTDIPLPTPTPYTPSPQTLLCHLATTILTLSSFPQSLARKSAADRSRPEPVFGVAEERDGVVLGRGANSGTTTTTTTSTTTRGGEGIVLEMEHRRKSGSARVGWYFLPPPLNKPVADSATAAKRTRGAPAAADIILLSDHPQWRRSSDPLPAPHHLDGGGGGDDGAVVATSTFSMDLTPKQRVDREGVVLPYFDAQRDGGGGGHGGGGRILYEMGVEDDFDEEEDED